MKVREIMSSPIVIISPDEMISEAAEKMSSYDVGVLPVKQKNKVVGMITDRDIVIRVIAERLDPKTTMVKQAMTREVMCCSEEDDVETAARMMEDRQIHRLLVLGSDDTLVGILSVADLACRAKDEHLTYEVLEKVCEPVHVECI
jgi:CBS domain-containing protein